ncbi:MFS transporter, ACS family, D-galactonate transporter [Paraburkholderia susongensis]|uniref:MFS transporter, ACS family, D-galactonate transporter n=2 Tax=Paraburkholderia susongensis TaxID=1515439 RepID=A0A1X7LPE8_9BURK|nr:MFS transporter [Paraburkholderia susongensis]SMG55705.1 MFS transporter, ACS family, D-galactonate transporter [Paraburkholderia susongensis]
MPAVRTTRVRFLMLFLVFVGTVINYVDRANLSVAAPLLKHEFGLGPVEIGVLFSAYAWTYVIANIPGGWVVDRFGSRVMYALAVLIWSGFTVAQGFAGRFATIFGLRLGVGVAEAPTFPVNNRVVSIWFTQRERGTATSVYLVGQYIGMAAFTPMLFWIAHSFGWRAIFWATGVIGIIWSGVWYLLYRDPEACSWVSEAELAYIREGGALVGSHRVASGAQKQKFPWRKLATVFSNRQIIAICMGKFASLSSLYFFLTWFPSYLISERHMTVLKAGGVTAVPFVAASIGVVAGGLLSDWLLRRGASVGAARKTPIITGLLLVPTMTLSLLTDSNTVVIAIMSFAFFAQGVASASWSLIGDIAPKSMIGITGGAVNFAGNLSGIVTPIAIGFILRETGSFGWALGLISLFAVLGALAYTFLLGEVKRIEIDDEPLDASARAVRSPALDAHSREDARSTQD